MGKLQRSKKGFDAYKKNAAAGGVMGMIQQIINDAKAMEAEVIRSEEDAQKAYEDFVKDTPWRAAPIPIGSRQNVDCLSLVAYCMFPVAYCL